MTLLNPLSTGDLGEETILLANTVRSFVEREIEPREDELRKANAAGIPPDLRQELQAKARRSGLWCFSTPAEFGGGGLEPLQLVTVLEQAVRHTYSLPDPGDGAFGYDPPNFLLSANHDQREQYLLPTVESGRQWFVAITEPSGGSDPARAIQTRAARTPAGWRITGQKLYISRLHEAEHGIVLARTGEGRRGISAFIVPKASEGLSYREVSVIRDHNTFELFLDDVEVPPENLLGEEGHGFDLAKGWLARGRISIAARALGTGQRALEMMISYAQARETFGKPLASRQSIQWMIVDSYLELHSARLIIQNAARAIEADSPDARSLASMAKLVGTEAAYSTVDRAIQVHGGLGLCTEVPLEHWFRALRTMRIVEGASEVQRMVLARELLSVSSSS